MMEISILLEARNPARNVWRSYHLGAGQDLFGNWVVEVTYGRIGATGHTKVVLVADETEARSYIEKCLKKRKSAPKRIGVGYQVRHIEGKWGQDHYIMDSWGNPNIG